MQRQEDHGDSAHLPNTGGMRVGGLLYFGCNVRSLKPDSFLSHYCQKSQTPNEAQRNIRADSSSVTNLTVSYRSRMSGIHAKRIRSLRAQPIPSVSGEMRQTSPYPRHCLAPINVMALATGPQTP